MKKICIGIPSYLPSKEIDRQLRIERLDRLLKQLKELFGFPIIFIAQNWGDYKPNYEHCEIFSHDKLGIIRARKELFNEFIKSEYDYIICFDDDAIIQGTKELCDEYVKLILEHDSCFAFVKGHTNSTYTKYADSQLNLCVISKDICKATPIPMLEAEKDDAFEDRIYSCLLHYLHSDKEIEIPNGLKCVHFKNPNEKAPSTWARDTKHDYDLMNAKTDIIERYIASHKCMLNYSNKNKIDIVIPYVSNKDIVWRNNYIDFCKKNRMNEKVVDVFSSKYGGVDFLEYQLKLIAKNMSWVNHIFLLVSNVEQLPKDLPSNCIVVLHNNFIPTKFLPTYNSCTIEMFLWNIPFLSERFIYANDDMLPIGKLEPKDFFGNGKIKIKWKQDKIVGVMSAFYFQCFNATQQLAKLCNYKIDKDNLLRPLHSFTPMIKSHCKEIFDTLKTTIYKHIWSFRTQYQFNQYIFPIYELYKYGTLDSDIDFLYTELSSDYGTLSPHQIICVNGEKKSEYLSKFMNELKSLCK